MEQILESRSIFVISPFQDTLAGILWCVFLGVVLVFVATLHQKATLGKAVKILREKGSTSEENALSKQDLGKIPPSALKGSGRLIETVVGEDGRERYFLPEKNFKKADAVLKTTSTPIWLALLEILALYLVLAILYYLIPWMFDLF